MIKGHTIRLKILLFSISLILLVTCKKDLAPQSSSYPPEISAIIINKCAISGCHTNLSKSAAAGLSLETWSNLFAGDNNGAVCIPYRHDQSTLFLFTNIDSMLGPINDPTMPYGKPPLSKQEVTTIINWIKNGAPDANGKVAFTGDPNRRKIYVTNQGCDLVTVFDAETQLQMRYIDAGVSPIVESAHSVKVSPDNKYWYTIFSASSTVLQKFRTSDDSYVGQINISPGSWNTISISHDSKTAYLIDWPGGDIAIVDLENMVAKPGSPWKGFFDAHGSVLNKNSDTLYVTAQTGNYFYKIPVNDPGSYEQVVLNKPSPPSPTTSYDPHELLFTPDYQYYYVTCQGKDQVRVYRTSDDSFVDSIMVGEYPLEMFFSENDPYLFVTCEYDQTPPELNRGCVSVINYQTNKEIKRLRLNMAEPHGVVVDDKERLVYVTNRNISGGSVPHHSSGCSGKNGFISFIDMNTLEVIPNKKVEVAVDPYGIGIRK